MESTTKYLQKELAFVFDSINYNRGFATVTLSARPDLSQFQSNSAFELGKELKTNPKGIAEKIVRAFKTKDYIKSMEVAGSGFINFTLTDAFLIEQLKNLAKNQIKNKKDGQQVSEKNNSKTTLIDFCGANVAKPMHVGHLRSTIIGDSLANLARHMGDNVITDNHIGDWGLQMGLLIAAVEEKYSEWDYFNKNFNGEYPSIFPLSLEDLEDIYQVASSRAKKDTIFAEAAGRAVLELQRGDKGYLALWKHFIRLSTEKMKRDLDLLKVHFDYCRGESYYQSMIPGLIKSLSQKQLSSISEGATIMPLDDMPGLEDTPPLILLKSDGASLYHTTDLATLIHRQQELKADRVLYVVDQRQSLHFKQIFAAAKKIGLLNKFENVEHIGFGTVNGRDGRPYKTREGAVMKLADLINLVIEKAKKRLKESGVADDYPPEEKEDITQKVGLATLKFSDLMNNRLSDYIFDLEKFSKFEGKTGPYILYTAVRIQSILRKAAKNNFSSIPLNSINLSNLATDSPFDINDMERSLILELLKLPDIYMGAYRNSSLNFLCEYLFNVCQNVNSFYRENHVLGESDAKRRGFWLCLLSLTLSVIKQTLDILGIEVPKRM